MKYIGNNKILKNSDVGEDKMGFNIKHLNKYWRWIKKNRAEYKDNCKISKEYAKLCCDLDFALLMRKSDAEIDRFAMRKHNWVLDYIKQKCPQTIERYRNMPAPNNLNEPNKEVKVWSMWWQGEEQADKLFKMCIDSARRHTGHDVITLTKDNYRDYFEIPDYILEKHKEGKIVLQHVCDLMLVSILAAEGGFFTGATVWWSQDVTDDFLMTPFYTCRAVTNRKDSISRSRWVGYLMAGNKDFPLFSFVRDCLYEYWKNCDKAVDYLMMDYIMEIAYQVIPCVKEVIDSLPQSNNLQRNVLINELSNYYDEKEFKKFTEGDTFLYKLSWKFGKKTEKNAIGKMTNYGYMLSECGDRI